MQNLLNKCIIIIIKLIPQAWFLLSQGKGGDPSEVTCRASRLSGLHPGKCACNLSMFSNHTGATSPLGDVTQLHGIGPQPGLVL